VGDVERWAATVLALLDARERDAAAWQRCRAAGIARASDFSWSRYTSAVVERYRAIAGAAAVEAT
jgi:glycosyltransferase involved in cell wall biosynthesis